MMPALIADIGARSFYGTFSQAFAPEDMRLYLIEKYSPELITKEIINPNAKFYLAYYNDTPAGYMKLVKSPVPEGIAGRYLIHLNFKKCICLRSFIVKKLEKN